jgi:hypothetical protein
MPDKIAHRMFAKALQQADQMSEWKLASKITDSLSQSPNAQTAMTEGLVGALQRSESFDMTRRITELLLKMPSFTPDQPVRLDGAIKSNGQVEQAVLGDHPVPEIISELIRSKGGLSTQATNADPWGR